MPTNFGPGDTVICKLNYGKLARAVSLEFECTQPFYIICFYEKGYLILVPNDIYLADSFILDKRKCKDLELLPKFVDTEVCPITDKHIISVQHRMTGVHCIKCDYFAEHGDTNRVDNNGKYVFLCWNCRTYPPYK